MSATIKVWGNKLFGKCCIFPLNVSKRHVILHYHLYKNAGSSVDHTLAANFGERWAKVEGEQLWSVLGATELANFVCSHSRLLAVSSHTARLPLPQLSNTIFYPIFFLRHPIDRVGSIYHFERQRPGEDFSAVTARENDLAGYVRQMLDNSDNEGVVLRNFHTLCLSNAAAGLTDLRQAKIDNSSLAEARMFLASLPAFGLVEYFNQSARRLERWLQGPFPGFNFPPAQINIQLQRKGCLDERIADVERELGPNLFQELLNANKYDMQIYPYALELFHSGTVSQTITQTL